jgi:hypothetical protein
MRSLNYGIDLSSFHVHHNRMINEKENNLIIIYLIIIWRNFFKYVISKLNVQMKLGDKKFPNLPFSSVIMIILILNHEMVQVMVFDDKFIGKKCSNKMI